MANYSTQLFGASAELEREKMAHATQIAAMKPDPKPNGAAAS